MRKIKIINCLNGDEEGPISTIIACTHGNELCGLSAFKKLIPILKIEKGQVFFIIGNPNAVVINDRFDEANLNRMYKPVEEYTEDEKHLYEYNRAQFLKYYLNISDALLDIHSSWNKSEPFVICEKNAIDIVKFLPDDFKRIVYGFDSIEPGGTDYYMNSIGKIGICVECGQHDDVKTSLVAENAIISFLKSRGHISSDLKSNLNREFIQMNLLYHTKTDSFKLAKEFDDFDYLKENQLIGFDGGLEIRAKNDSYIIFAKNRNTKGEEAFLSGYKI